MAKKIPLTKGQFAIVDNDKFEWLNQWRWFARWNKATQSFYACRMSKQVFRKYVPKHTISMAREILGLIYGDKRQSDHRDHNTLDNQTSNLRIVTHQQNQLNQRNPKGYCWCKGKYQAYIKLNSKQIYLGRFHTIVEAHNAYLNAKKQYHNF